MWLHTDIHRRAPLQNTQLRAAFSSTTPATDRLAATLEAAVVTAGEAAELDGDTASKQILPQA